MTGWAEFIRARLAEDEAEAKDGLCVNCGQRTAPLRNALGVTGHTHSGGWEGVRCPGRITGAVPVQNPARVLRQVQAMREILQLAFEADNIHYDRCTEVGSDPPSTPVGEEMRQALGSIWSDHPDYGKAGG